MRRRCKWGIHDWSDWVTSRVTWVWTDRDNTNGWVQHKVCQSCGKRREGATG